MILRNFKNKNKGMTYVELIVVLSIFSTLSAVVIFNYGAFQDKIDVKNLTSDIALRLVESQKLSVSGRLPPFPWQSEVVPSWRTSYGINFNLGESNQMFKFLVDLDQDGVLDGFNCTGGGECLEAVTITKGGVISEINIFYHGNEIPTTLNDLTITFIRPSGAAIMTSTSGLSQGINYAEIVIVSPRDFTARAKIFSSGRIELD